MNSATQCHPRGNLIDYMPAHIAANLLTPQSNKKWKTKTVGERSAFVVLELDEPYFITGIDIGNEHSAFVEVLVGNAGHSNDNFTEILITSSFMTPIESKNCSNINRVRFFGQGALVENALSSKWKFIKVICTQPFNKHVQYGLAFIKIHASDEPTKTDLRTYDTEKLKRKGSPPNQCEEEAKIPSLGLGLFSLREDSPESESESSSGLFNRWKVSRWKATNSPVSIASEIRDESMRATSNESSQSNLVKTDIKPKVMYIKLTETALERNAIQQAHKDVNNSLPGNKQQTDLKKGHKIQKYGSIKESTNTKSSQIVKPSSSLNNIEQTIIYRPFSKLLQGVVLVLSGIQNPLRADLRNKALAMGAKYKSDWENGCTHLICAFKNTPKYNKVKSKGKIVTRQWIDRCYETKKYLPWRRFALDSDDSSKPESDEEIFDETHSQKILEVYPNNENEIQANSFISLMETNRSIDLRYKSSGSDTDDDIQRAVSNNLKRNVVKANFDIEKDEKTTIGDSIYEALTEEEDFLKDKY